LVLRLRGGFLIFVKHSKGNTINVEIELDDKVE
jgi:hypothetical protein